VGEAGRPADTRQAAARLVALDRLSAGHGLDWGHALASITSGPAKAVSLDHDIGSLLPGRRADLVIWDGDPLEPGSGPVRLFIDGIDQPLETRQTLLRQRYGVGSLSGGVLGADASQLPGSCK
jgi:N-acyl-D-aspartate/D-glutamate deacylase